MNLHLHEHAMKNSMIESAADASVRILPSTYFAGTVNGDALGRKLRGTKVPVSLRRHLCREESIVTLAGMIFYEGKRTRNGTFVTRRVTDNETVHLNLADEICAPGDRVLSLRLDLATHSPTGFDWGYGGSGPAQLALALLADALGDDEKALSAYQLFKREIVVSLPHRKWRLSDREIRDAARRLAAATADAWD